MQPFVIITGLLIGKAVSALNTGCDDMKFKRIDTDTVRCLISESELNENGLEIADFVNNKEKTEDFLRKIINMAEKEVDYKVQGGPISVQVAVVDNNTLALTLSEKQEQNILEMLQNLRSAVEALAIATKQPEAVPAEETEKKTVQKKTSAQKKNSVDLGKRLDRDIYELEFESFDHFLKYCNSITIGSLVENCLYKIESNGCYYLLLTKDPMTDNELCKLLGASLDFTRGIYSDGRMKAYLEEHGICILPEHAIQHVKELD